MHGSNDGSFVLDVTRLVGNGERWERLPDDVLADVNGDEQGNSRSDSVSFLKHFVQKKDDHSGHHKLDNNKIGVKGAEVG